MRPHAYGGYCALDNNLPKPPLHAYQNQSQNASTHQQHKSLPPYARSTTYPPPHLQHPQQHQHHHQQQHHQQQHLPNLAYQQHQHNQHAPLPPAYQNSAQYPQARNARTCGTFNGPQLPAPPSSSSYKHHAVNFNLHAPPQGATPAPNQQRLLPSELANAHNYAKLPPPDAVNQQRIHECAGIPLISAAFTQRQQQQRLQRKPSAAANPSNCHWQPPPLVSRETKHAANIVQMAAHAQGSPILLPKTAPFWSSLHNQSNNARQQMRLSPPTLPTTSTMQHFAQSKMPTDKSRLCYQHSAPPAFNTGSGSSGCTIAQNKENHLTTNQETLMTTNNNSMSNSNSSATSSTNDELSSKDSTENCLPRIIKPRKRRKKDRKPANGVFLKLELELAAKTASENMLKHSSSMDFNYFNNKPNNGCPLQFANPTTKIEHQTAGNCFCSNCNPLRSIWEYPLRRSHSDSSNASANDSGMRLTKQNGCISPVLSTTSSSSSTSSSANSTTDGSSSTISLAQKNAETENFSPITTESTRANIVGIIGSNRAQNHGNNHQKSNHDASLSMTFEQPLPQRAASTNNHLSDKTHTNGYSDILGGINLADDLFKNVVASRTSSTSSSTSANFNNNNSLVENFHCPLLLPTSAAERLLNASINEISRQLIETCINEPTTTTTTTTIDVGVIGDNNVSLGTFSTCSDLSNDSGLDSAGSLPSTDEVIFKFDDLNLNFDTTDLHENQKSTNMLNVFLDFNNNVTTFKHNDEQTKQSTTTVTTPMLLNQIFENDEQHQNQQHFTQNCYELIWRDLSKMSGKNFELNDTNALKSAINNASFSSIPSK